VILHVGTMEKPSGKRLGQHLGTPGSGGRAEGSGEKQEKPHLVVLTEWGYEFGRLRCTAILRGGRGAVLVEERLQQLGCDAYVAAVPVTPAPGKSPSSS